MSIGVLGGTFDPIHRGHIGAAETVRTRLGLAKVLFVPAGQPPLKEDSSVLEARHREQMVRLAIAGYPYFELSAIEIERAGLSYTVDTIAQLQVQFGERDELLFILSWGSLAQLPQWREPSRLIQMCRLVAVPRPGYLKPDIQSLERAIPGLSQRLILLEEPEIDISATDIRNRVAHGLPVNHLVPEAVEEYIRRHKLYLPPERAQKKFRGAL